MTLLTFFTNSIFFWLQSWPLSWSVSAIMDYTIKESLFKASQKGMQFKCAGLIKALTDGSFSLLDVHFQLGSFINKMEPAKCRKLQNGCPSAWLRLMLPPRHRLEEWSNRVWFQLKQGFMIEKHGDGVTLFIDPALARLCYSESGRWPAATIDSW